MLTIVQSFVFLCYDCATGKILSDFCKCLILLVPGAGIEPARLAAGDFEETGTAASY